MGIEYNLGRTSSGKYQQLECGEGEDAIVRDLSMLGFGDCISFEKKNKDGSMFGSCWGLGNIGCFREMRSCARLSDMFEKDLERLGTRMYELLYMKNRGEEKYGVEPRFDKAEVKYRQIVGELMSLQGAQKRLVDSGEIVFSGVSDEELANVDLW